jgi:hypothetical protein
MGNATDGCVAARTASLICPADDLRATVRNMTYQPDQGGSPAPARGVWILVGLVALLAIGTVIGFVVSNNSGTAQSRHAYGAGTTGPAPVGSTTGGSSPATTLVAASPSSTALPRGRILVPNIAQTDPQHRVPADVPVPLFPKPPVFRVATTTPAATMCAPKVEPGVEYDFVSGGKATSGLGAIEEFGAYLLKHGWVKLSFSFDVGPAGGGISWLREDGTQVIAVEQQIPASGPSTYVYTWNPTRPGSGQQKLGRVLAAGVAQTDGTGHLPASVPVPAVGCTFEPYHPDPDWHFGRWPVIAYDGVSQLNTRAYVTYMRAHGWSYRVSRHMSDGSEVVLTKGSHTIYWDVTAKAPALWHYHP